MRTMIVSFKFNFNFFKNNSIRKIAIEIKIILRIGKYVFL